MYISKSLRYHYFVILCYVTPTLDCVVCYVDADVNSLPAKGITQLITKCNLKTKVIAKY